MSSKVVQILSHASRSVLMAVDGATEGQSSLLALSQTALNQADRKALKSLVEECNRASFDFARGVAAGLLAVSDTSDVRLVVSAPFRTNERQTAGVIAELIGGSQRTLFVCSFVLVYLDELLPLFRAAKDRGVEIRVLLDYAAAQTKAGLNTVSILGPILGTDSLRFWDSNTQGEESLHAKFLLADGKKALVTSANMTGRAITRNVEAGLLVHDPGTLEGLHGLFANLWGGALKP